jgi:hypothetical protein
MKKTVLGLGLIVLAAIGSTAGAQPIGHSFSPMRISVHDDGNSRIVRAEVSDEKGNAYVLKQVDDKVVQFSVNGKEIARENYSSYVDIFDKVDDWADTPPVPPVPPLPPLSPMSAAVAVTAMPPMPAAVAVTPMPPMPAVAAMPSMAPMPVLAPVPPLPPVSPTSDYFIRHIIRDLQQDKLIDREDPLSFSLDSEGLKVNGAKQPEAVFRRYKEKYLDRATDHFIYRHSGGSTHTEISTDKKAPDFI